MHRRCPHSLIHVSQIPPDLHANPDRSYHLLCNRISEELSATRWGLVRILGYLFRATQGGILRVSGLASVDIKGIENVNVTDEVPGHMAYRGMMPTLLDKVGWQMESLEYSEIEDPDPENHEKRQRELINEIEEARRQLEEEPQKKGFKSWFTKKKQPQKKSWETYDERSQKVLEGDDKESEQHAAETANVMFDGEAIRAEALKLALQQPGDIEEIKTLAHKLETVDGTQAARTLSARMLAAVPRFEATEEVSFHMLYQRCANKTSETQASRISTDSQGTVHSSRAWLLTVRRSNSRQAYAIYIRRRGSLLRRWLCEKIS